MQEMLQNHLLQYSNIVTYKRLIYRISFELAWEKLLDKHMNMACRELWTRKGTNRKTLEPKLKVYGLYTDSKTHNLLFCHSVMPSDKIKTVLLNLTNGMYWHFGYNWTAPVAASEVPFRLHPSHFNTLKLRIDSIATVGPKICVVWACWHWVKG